MVEPVALIAISIFTLVLIAIGYHYRRNRIPEDFFMAGRKAGMVRIASSIFTLFGAGEIVTLTALAYIYGISGLSLFFGVIVGFIALAFLSNRIRKNHTEYKPYTLTDYINKFLGPKSEKLSIIISLIAVLSLLVIQLVVGGLLISTLAGLSYVTSVIIIGVVIAVYLTLGGFNSVLTTDVLQAISMVILLLFLLVLYNPQGSSIGNIISHAQEVVPPVDFIVLFILGIFVVLGSTDVYQRIFASSLKSSLKKGLIWTGVLWIAFSSLMLLLGLKIFSQYPLADPNNAFFDFLSGGLSPFLLTIVSIFIVASLFSTADTELFLSSLLIGRLFVKKEKLSSLFSQIAMWLIIIVSMGIAIYFTSLVDIYFFLLYMFSILGVTMLARLLGRGNDLFAFWGMILALVVIVLLGVFNLVTGWYPLLILVPPLISFLVPSKND